MVRAKFRVTNVEESNGTSTVYLSPVTSGSEENERFYKYTPGGQIILATINPEAAEQFVIGEEYYADFTHADA